MFILLFLLPFLGTSGMIWLVAVVAVLVYFYRSVKKKQSFWERKGIKSLKPKFLLGNMEIFRSKAFVEKIEELYSAFPEARYHGFYQFTQPTLMLKDPELIKQITIKEFEHFTDHRTVIDTDVDPFWNKNLFASQGQRWRDLRSTLSPSFTSSKMKIMFSLIEESARQFVDFFKNHNHETIELEMKDTFSRYTNDVIATTAFGLKIDSLRDRNNKFYLTGKDASDFGGLRILKFFVHSLSPSLSKLLKIKIIPPSCANYFSKIIKDTVNTRKEKNIVRPDMIHLLMEAQKGRQVQEDESKISEGFSSVSESEITRNKRKQEITLDDIISQAFVFFLAGFETVSTLLTFFFYEQAINPDIQSKLRKEINAIEDITYEKLLSLKYLDMVVSETLRKWPAAMVSDRKVTKAFTIEPERPDEKPLHLEEGLVCWLPIYALHRDPKLYPNPEKFDPERFSDENRHKINPSGYIPFGSGPRNCIGSRFALLEAKLIICLVLKEFEVVPIGRTQIPVKLDKRSINMAAEGGMWLGFKKIQ